MNYLAKINKAQRFILALAISLVLLLLLIHNPVSGYTYTYLSPNTILLPACSDKERFDYRVFLTDIYSSDLMKAQREFADENLGGVAKVIGIRVANCHMMKQGVPIDIASYDEKVEKYLSFDEWRSNSPAFIWMGYIVNFCCSAAAIMAVGIVFSIYVFSDKK